ncbi:MAG: hypothetical protein IPP71_09470 [Bacteroidetes bacterium]|nr:hypothetical protein [Bacteroidota bacterium]
MPLTKWSVGPYKLHTIQGIHQSSAAPRESNSIDDEYNITLRTEKLVEQYYHDSFYTVTNGDSSKLKLQDFLTSFPSEISDVFSMQALSKIQGKFLWIKLQFNSAIPVNAVQDVFVSVNAFPAINRKINRITYQLKNNMNIVPLMTESLFHDMVNVISSEGSRYRSNPLDSGFNNSDGYYTLRHGSVERFDQRHAMELLTNVIDRLRDESAAFSSLGNDFINVQINQINQALAMIDNRLDLKGTHERPTQFLLIKPLRKNDTVFAKFWTTNGLDANSVKPGTKLTLQSGSDIKSDSLFTIVTTSGGKMPLSENEKVIAYKKALLTHDRLLTEQDIHTFCMFELGNLIQNVEVRKSWEITGTGRVVLQELLKYAFSP